MAPILLFGIQFYLPKVVATDLLFATITKLVATGSHNKNSLVDWQVSKRLWLGSIPATLIVIILAYYGWLFANLAWITTLLGALILVSGLSLVLGYHIQLYLRTKLLLYPDQFKCQQPAKTSLAGFIIGALVSATSIGTGALGGMMLRALYLLRMEPKKLVAMDMLHAVPVSLLVGLGYLLMGNTNIELLKLLLTGSIPAVLVGTKLLRILPNNLIRLSLGCILITAALKLLLN